jgi:hypothetical protein
MKQDTTEKEESVRGLKSHHTDLLTRKENRKFSIVRYGVIVLAVLVPYLLILIFFGTWLVQAVQQTQGIAPKYTYILMFIFYSIILILALKKYGSYIIK